MECNFVPVLLGGDLNGYNLARAFHEKYGIRSEVFGRYAVSATEYSKIINFHIVENLTQHDAMVNALRSFAASVTGKKLILLGLTDGYVEMIIKNRPRLEDLFTIPYIGEELYYQLEDKLCFYHLCDKYGILYPKTHILSKGFSEAELSEESLGFSYPVILKPSSSINYWKHPFDGMKKVYRLSTPAETAAAASEIFASGYEKELIVQDFIPGDDSGMHVLTTYSDKNRKVVMKCLGHVLLEEHTPKGLGNHASIITEYNPELTEKLSGMLDSVGYRGFANFDIKFDPRDGTMRAFEVNLRQGRSNYYITSSGINIAELLVRDCILGESIEPVEASAPHFWTSVPKSITYRYTADKALKSKVRALVKSGKASSSLLYGADLRGNPKRCFVVFAHLFRQIKKFRKYMG